MRAQLGGSSRQSLVAARTALDAAVKGVDAQTASTLSAELSSLQMFWVPISLYVVP